MPARIWSGGCNCGKVRLALRGEPLRVGLCHCLTCRKETGSAFMAFAVWEADALTVTGSTASWIETTDHRHFCPNCGSSLFGTSDTDSQVEVRIGALDEAPSGLTPEYELWVPRREHWQPELPGAVQHQRNRS
jgi:hypothetical protein